MKFKVFISSTILDMQELRKMIKNKLQKMRRIIPILSEYPDSFPKPKSPEFDKFESSIYPIKECDILVLIINKMYGNIKPGEDKSITESENDEAVDNFIPRSVFVEYEVANDYKHYNELRGITQRNDYLEYLKGTGYDNPKKTMKFLSKLSKLKSMTLTDYKDGWYWSFKIQEKTDFLSGLHYQIKNYINEYISEKKNEKKTIKVKRSEIIDLRGIKKILSKIKKSRYVNPSRDYFDILISKEPKDFDLIKDFENDCISSQDKRCYNNALESLTLAFRELEKIDYNNNNKLKNAYYPISFRLYIRRGIIFRMIGQKEPQKYDDSITSFNNALNISTKIVKNNLKNTYKVIAYICLADVYRVSGNFGKYEKLLVEVTSTLNNLIKKKITTFFCIGYLKNQIGLMNLEKGISSEQFFEDSKKSFVESIFSFLKVNHKRWILKSIMDYFACVYKLFLINNSTNKIDIVLENLDTLQFLNNFNSFQEEHNILNNKAKFLMIKMDENSLNDAESLIRKTLERSHEQDQKRVIGAELMILAQILIAKKDFQKALINIKEGINYLNEHLEVKNLSIYDFNKYLGLLESSGFDNIDQYKDFKNELTEIL